MSVTRWIGVGIALFMNFAGVAWLLWRIGRIQMLGVILAMRSRRDPGDFVFHRGPRGGGLLWPAGWFSTLELRGAFGGDVYTVLRILEDDGHIERLEEPGGPERGGRPRIFYRWKRPLPPEMLQ